MTDINTITHFPDGVEVENRFSICMGDGEFVRVYLDGYGYDSMIFSRKDAEVLGAALLEAAKWGTDDD